MALKPDFCISICRAKIWLSTLRMPRSSTRRKRGFPRFIAIKYISAFISLFLVNMTSICYAVCSDGQPADLTWTLNKYPGTYPVPTPYEACEMYFKVLGWPGSPHRRTEIVDEYNAGVVPPEQKQCLLWNVSGVIAWTRTEPQHCAQYYLAVSKRDNERNLGVPEKYCPLGNPINPFNGNKYHVESDYRMESSSLVGFTRTYNSKSSIDQGMGVGWMHAYARHLKINNIAPSFHGGSDVVLGAFSGTEQLACENAIPALQSSSEYAWAASAVYINNMCTIESADNTNSISAPVTSTRDTETQTTPGIPVIPQILVVRGDGKTHEFRRGVDGWESVTPTYEQLSEIYDTNSNQTGWEYKTSEDNVESYDTSGQLQSIHHLNGIDEYLTYTQGKLSRIDISTGQYLDFQYNTFGRISSITDNAVRIWGYRYDSNNNLEFIDYPDGEIKQYHYEDATFPNALTGITDERGVRYSTYEYDTNGNAAASYHGTQTSINTDRIEGVSIVYNADGTRTVTNSNDNASTYTTASQIGVGLVTDVTGPGCSTCGTSNTSYNYDPASNNLLSRTQNGITTRYGNYDSNGNYRCMVEGVADADTSPGECDFNPTASPDARRTDYTYDTRYFSKVATLTEPSVYPGASKITTYDYDDFGNHTSETIAGYTPNGTPVSRSTTWQYNGPLHQLSRIDGPRTDVSDIINYRYYPDDPLEGSNRARMKEVEDATGVLTRSNIQYTATGKVASELRPNGLNLTYTYYPGNDRLETLTEAGSNGNRTTRWTYLATGEVETITTADATPAATPLTFGYDAARRLTRITDGLGNYIEYTLDTEGNRTFEKTYDSSDILKKQLHQTFDIYNRLDVSSQANESVDYDFAPNGTLDQSIDGRGSIADYSYDTLKRLVTSTQDLGNLAVQTVYGYDIADRLTSVIDPNSNATRYAYDDLGNLLTQTSPDSGTMSYQYDDAGNRIQQTDAKGQVLTYSYDALNRLISIDAFLNRDDISYTYDSCANGTGRLCSVVRDLTTVNYRYTPQGDVAGLDQARTTWPGYQQADSTLDLTYDAAGRRKTLTYPSGAIVTYHYDAAGQVSGVDLDTGGTMTALMSNATYLPFGPLTGQRLGNGLDQVGLHDMAYRTWVLYSATFYDVLYYDTNGNAHSQYTSAGTHAHSYDALDRLDTSTGPYGSRDYDHDPNGNRSQLIDDDSTTTYGYTPASNRLSAIDGTSVTLDPNGNTTSLAGLILTYTTDNRLKAVTGVAAYAYNGQGQRVQKSTRAAGLAGQYGFGHKRVFIYGPEGSLLAELGPTGQVTREYIHANGTLLAVIDHAPDSGEPILNGDMDRDGAISIEDFLEWYYNHYLNVFDPAYEVTGDGLMDQADVNAMIVCVLSGTCLATAYETRIYYAHSDHLGTPHALSDTAGIKVWNAVYDPFGKATVDEDTDGNGTAVTLNVRFSGQYYDQETELHYNYFRYYDPSTGRYITSDPIGLAGGLNTYAYVDANPINFSDPEGLLSRSQTRRRYNQQHGARVPGSSIGPFGAKCGSFKNGPHPSYIPDLFPNTCEWHDQCYGDCNKTQSDCDLGFIPLALTECPNGLSPACLLAAMTYSQALSGAGGDAYDNAQKENGCDGC